MNNSRQQSQYHHGDLREAMIAAAMEHIEATQDWSFSLRAIAKIVGVSHNAPYAHFSDKKALLAAVAARGFDSLTKTMTQACTEDDAEANMIATGRAYIQFGRSHPGLYRLMFDPSFALAPPQVVESAGRRAYRRLVDALKGLAIEAPLTEEDLSAKAFTAWGLVHGLTSLILGRQGLGKKLCPDDALPPFVDEGLKSLIRGFGSGTKEKNP